MNMEPSTTCPLPPPVVHNISSLLESAFDDDNADNDDGDGDMNFIEMDHVSTMSDDDDDDDEEEEEDDDDGTALPWGDETRHAIGAIVTVDAVATDNHHRKAVEIVWHANVLWTVRRCQITTTDAHLTSPQDEDDYCWDDDLSSLSSVTNLSTLECPIPF